MTLSVIFESIFYLYILLASLFAWYNSIFSAKSKQIKK